MRWTVARAAPPRRRPRRRRSGSRVLVLVTALIAALAPRVLAGARRRGRPGRGRGPRRSSARNIVAARSTGSFGRGPADDPLAQVRAAGDELLATVPGVDPRASSSARTSRSRAAASGSRRRRPTRPSSGSGSRRAIGDHIRYVEGGPPTRDGRRPATTSGRRRSTTCPSTRPRSRAATARARSASRSARPCRSSATRAIR